MHLLDHERSLNPSAAHYRTPLPRYDTREHAVKRHDRPAEAHSGTGSPGNHPAEPE